MSKSKPKTRAGRSPAQIYHQKLRMLIFSIVFGLVGAVIVLSTYAATPPIEDISTIQPYGQFEWSAMEVQNTNILINPDTDREGVITAQGKTANFKKTGNESKKIYTFYLDWLKKRGYALLSRGGDINTGLWVATYRNNNSIIEVQHFPSPNNHSIYTTQVFLGTI